MSCDYRFSFCKREEKKNYEEREESCLKSDQPVDENRQPLMLQRFKRGLAAYQEGDMESVIREWCHAIGERPLWQQTQFAQVLKALVCLPLLELEQQLRGVSTRGHTRYCCLALAVLLSPEEFETWHALICFCKTDPDVGSKETYVRKIWSITEVVKVPDPILTPDDEVELSDRSASLLRKTRGEPEIWGIPIRDYQDWVVTTWGVECTVVPYDIHWRSIWSHCWEEAILVKRGTRGSYQDFLIAKV